MNYTFDYIEAQYEGLVAEGYTFLSCANAFELIVNGPGLPEKCVINRIDVDLNVRRAGRLARIFSKLGIEATFFIRLHANEYNPMAFENFNIIRHIQSEGFEIGYHSEIIDGGYIFNESPSACLKRDLAVINAMLGVRVSGIASHGGMTGLNNLDFWEDHSPSDFGCTYEAYDERLFFAGLYVSDSEWTRWKSYRRGGRVEGCDLSPLDHGRQGEPLIYLLIHSDTYFDHHIYEA